MSIYFLVIKDEGESYIFFKGKVLTNMFVDCTLPDFSFWKEDFLAYTVSLISFIVRLNSKVYTPLHLES